MTDLRRNLYLQSTDLEELNRVMLLLQDRLDELEGRRGTPTFYSAIDMEGNKITNATQGSASGEMLTADLATTDLELTSGRLGVKVNTASGLERSTDGIGVIVKTDGGVGIDVDEGLYADAGNIDHGSLSGLGDDDHLIYHTDARALTWHTALPGDHVTNGDSHDHVGGDGAAIVEAAITLADNVTNDLSITKHGFAPKAPNDATKFLDGTAAWDTVKDSDLSTSDIATNNVTTAKHGFITKAPNDAKQFFRGDATWARPTKTRYTPNSVTVNTGTYVSGNVASVSTPLDDDWYEVDEVTGVPGFDVEIGFVSVANFNRINLHIAYLGSATHQVNVQLYNHNTTNYDIVHSFFSTQGSWSWFTFEGIPDTNYISGGVVTIQIYHVTSGNAAHTVYIEYIELVDDCDG